MTTKAKKKTFPAMYCETVADTIKALSRLPPGTPVMVGNAEADVAEILRNENMEDENAAFIANALDELESLRKSRIAELNVELDRAGSKHDAAVRRADDAEALLREARSVVESHGDAPELLARIDAHLSAKEKT